MSHVIAVKGASLKVPAINVGRRPFEVRRAAELFADPSSDEARLVRDADLSVVGHTRLL